MTGQFKSLICSLAVGLSLAGCFTGIESTPRISQNDVRKREAVDRTPEQKFMSDIRPEAPSLWHDGKRFFVTDDKISIIFAPDESDVDSLAGHDLVFKRFEDVPSLTGNGATIAVFDSPGRKGEFRYRIDVAPSELSSRDRLEVPFTVERSVVECVDSMMKGQTYYISTPKWFKASDNSAFMGKRHIPAKITKVEAGTFIYPLKVFFSPDNYNEEFWIPMTVGSDRAATRNFHLVFNFDNPRKRYPRITDETWQLITDSKVAVGMTRDECRLALGAPNSFRTIPVINAVVEQWSYDDGMYLIFEDGILTRFRI